MATRAAPPLPGHHAQHQAEPVLRPGLQRGRRTGSCRGALPLPRHSGVADVRRRGNEPVFDLGDRQCAAAEKRPHLSIGKIGRSVYTYRVIRLERMTPAMCGRH